MFVARAAMVTITNARANFTIGHSFFRRCFSVISGIFHLKPEA